MKNSGGKSSSSSTTTTTKGEMKRDRISRTGMSGSPKKGGHGGKYTWAGGDVCSSFAENGFENGALDAKDPNFEDPLDHTDTSKA